MQYRPAQLRTKNIHENINNVYVCINMLEIEKLVLSYNKRHQISRTTGLSIVTISHLLSNGQNNPNCFQL